MHIFERHLNLFDRCRNFRTRRRCVRRLDTNATGAMPFRGRTRTIVVTACLPVLLGRVMLAENISNFACRPGTTFVFVRTAGEKRGNYSRNALSCSMTDIA